MDSPLGLDTRTILAHWPSHSSPCGARGIEFDVRFAPFFFFFPRPPGPAGPFCIICPPSDSRLMHVAHNVLFVCLLIRAFARLQFVQVKYVIPLPTVILLPRI
ncbi:MAG: hypothetical protein [Circular genetic element sp.]|nr:MAG: hypothetical protein [Circular genetic element sp.]